ncbi:MAG: sugar transferase [Candidatus Roizmanbacteria bacterium]
MSERREKHTNYSEELGDIDLSLSPHALHLFSRVVGFDVTAPVTEEQIQRSQRWIHGSHKRLFEKSLCHLIGFLGGRALAKLGESTIRRIDGFDGLVTIEVGFLGSDGPVMHPEIKIRTMVPDASQLLVSPFEHSSFIGENGRGDPRVLNSRIARLMRRTAFDEIPQIVYQVPEGKLAVVGTRGYTRPELAGTQILVQMARDSMLDLSTDARALLDTYQAKVDRYAPIPGLTSLFQATTVKGTTHLSRMYGDVAYWERATPLVDLRIALISAKQRAKGVGVW